MRRKWIKNTGGNIMYLSVALEMNSVTPRQKITYVCLIVPANPITYVTAILIAIFDFDFFCKS